MTQRDNRAYYETLACHNLIYDGLLTGDVHTSNITDLNTYLTTWVGSLPGPSTAVGYKDNIAALQATTATLPSVISVSGYYTKGDGGGGSFWYDSSDTTSAQDNATIIWGTATGAGPKPRWKRIMGTKRVNPAWWGAKGDWTQTNPSPTDDAPAINSCITYCYQNFNNGAPTKYITAPNLTNKAKSPNMGGAVIDFDGKSYFLQSPLRVPPATFGGAGLVLCNGWLHAGPNFQTLPPTEMGNSEPERFWRQHGRAVIEVIYVQAGALLVEDIHLFQMHIDAGFNTDFCTRWGSVNNSTVSHCTLEHFRVAGVYSSHYENYGVGGDDIFVHMNNIWQYRLGEGTTSTFAGYAPGVLTGYGIYLDSNDSYLSHNMIINCKVGIKLGTLRYQTNQVGGVSQLTIPLVPVASQSNQNGGATVIKDHHIWNCEQNMVVADSVSFTAEGNYFDQAGITISDPYWTVINGNEFVPGINTAAVLCKKHMNNDVRKLVVTSNVLAGANQANNGSLDLSATGPVGTEVTVTFTAWTPKPDVRWGNGIQVWEGTGLTEGMGYFTSITSTAGDSTGTMMVTRLFTSISMTAVQYGFVSAGVVFDPNLLVGGFNDNTIVQNNCNPAGNGIINPFMIDQGTTGWDARTFPYKSFFQSPSNGTIMYAEQNGFRMLNGATAMMTLKTGSGTSFGSGATAVGGGQNAIAIGPSSTASAASCLAIGSSSTASATTCIAIGPSASASAVNCVAIGASVSNSTTNTILLGKAGLDTTVGGALAVTGLATVGGTLAVTGLATVGGNLTTTGHMINNSGTPTMTAFPALGTTPTISVSGNDQAGVISITPGTTPTGGSLCRLTFAVAYPAAPKSVVLSAANQASASLSGAATVFVIATGGVTSSYFQLQNSATLVAGTLYMWAYQVMG